jgi:4-amino-4-deoxychorismate lyase
MSSASLVSVLVNGKDQRSVGVLDRGLNYGDGVFETIAVNDSIPRLLEFHWQRLEHSCRALAIPLDLGLVQEEAASLLEAHPLQRGILKIVVTRGVDGLGYQYGPGCENTRIVSLHRSAKPNPDNAKIGIAARICDARLARQQRLAGIKHLNRLEQVLARAEWNDTSIAEGLMRDTEGWVVEGTRSNLFIVENGRLVTPRLDYCGVSGVMRRAVMEIICNDLSIACGVEDISKQRLLSARELFVCNSVFGVWPVNRIDDKRWSPGAITRQIQSAAEKLLHG